MAADKETQKPTETHKGQSSSPCGEWHEGMLFHNRKRTRLSNERTFLSWVRTSLALITLGFVVQRFDLFLASAGFAGEAVQLPPIVK
jgi:hypothetical protein